MGPWARAQRPGVDSFTEKGCCHTCVLFPAAVASSGGSNRRPPASCPVCRVRVLSKLEACAHLHFKRRRGCAQTNCGDVPRSTGSFSHSPKLVLKLEEQSRKFRADARKRGWAQPRSLVRTKVYAIRSPCWPTHRVPSSLGPKRRRCIEALQPQCLAPFALVLDPCPTPSGIRLSLSFSHWIASVTSLVVRFAINPREGWAPCNQRPPASKAPRRAIPSRPKKYTSEPSGNKSHLHRRV